MDAYINVLKLMHGKKATSFHKKQTYNSPDEGSHTRRNLFGILFNQTEIRLYNVYTSFRLIWNQTDVSLVPNQPENGKYNLISVWFNNISKIFLCVQETKASRNTIILNFQGAHETKKNWAAILFFIKLFPFFRVFHWWTRCLKL